MPRAVGAADGGPPVQGPGRPPALARAVDERRRALAVVDDPAGDRIEPASRRRRRRRAARGRCPRRTCAAPGRTAPAARAPRSGPAMQAPVSQVTGERALEPVGLGSRPDRVGLQRRRDQSPDPGPGADLGAARRRLDRAVGVQHPRPDQPLDPQRLGGEPVEPVVEQLRVGVEQHGRLAGRLAHADVRAGAEAEVLIQADEPVLALPLRRRLGRRVGGRVVDDDQLLIAVEVRFIVATRVRRWPAHSQVTTTTEYLMRR